MPETAVFQRSTAQKVSLGEIQNGEFIHGNEQEANYLLTKKGKKIFRVNIIAAVVDKQTVGTITNMILDDGTGKLILRSFEENEGIKKIEVGTVILIIGKVRTFNEEKYVSPEVVRRIEPLWLKVRAHENLEKEKIQNNQNYKKENTIEKNDINKKEKSIKNESQEENIPPATTIVEEDQHLPFQKLMQTIKELDKGDGALIEEILEKSALKDSDKVLTKMLECGEIFEYQPGKVKVL